MTELKCPSCGTAICVQGKKTDLWWGNTCYKTKTSQYQQCTRLPTVRIALILSIMALTCAAGPSELATYRHDLSMQYPTVRQISTAALAQWLSDSNRPPPLILDVRGSDEYRVSHLKDAQLVSKDTARIVARDQLNLTPIVVYCSIGKRSSEFARDLQQAGHTNVFNLDGSIFQWANEGRPVFAGSNIVTGVHPYNRKWGRFLKKELHAKQPAEK